MRRRTVSNPRVAPPSQPCPASPSEVVPRKEEWHVVGKSQTFDVIGTGEVAEGGFCSGSPTTLKPQEVSCGCSPDSRIRGKARSEIPRTSFMNLSRRSVVGHWNPSGSGPDQLRLPSLRGKRGNHGASGHSFSRRRLSFVRPRRGPSSAPSGPMSHKRQASWRAIEPICCLVTLIVMTDSQSVTVSND